MKPGSKPDKTFVVRVTVKADLTTTKKWVCEWLQDAINRSPTISPRNDIGIRSGKVTTIMTV